ncbi:MAG: DUF494 domain-containing protein [Gammaproteobacteria bacterium]|nr:DUF494 domain-containing protein [Gammaproteobacteria bacterium]MBU1558820.1 DUF494 domain-containing protein [Gammaproteobacteria bacterium]MBU1628573.1 DUF494 domain-containing protein [Gammaproteobacteria bacterium]MBU2545564.1 DUF494 domain-containing protein [Gammaproteobacteria bacterium]
MIEVLTYLFDSYFDTNALQNNYEDQAIDDMKREVIEAGFQTQSVDETLLWFRTLKKLLRLVKKIKKVTRGTFRILTDEEQKRLSVDAQEYLLSLERIGVLNAVMREVVLDRLMALDEVFLDVKDVKVVVFMVLYYCPSMSKSLQLLEDILFSEDKSVVH